MKNILKNTWLVREILILCIQLLKSSPKPRKEQGGSRRRQGIVKFISHLRVA